MEPLLYTIDKNKLKWVKNLNVMPESTVSLLLRKGVLQSDQHPCLPPIFPSLSCSTHTSNHPVCRGFLGKDGVINYSLYPYGPQIIKCPSMSHCVNIPGWWAQANKLQNKSSSITYYTSCHVSQRLSFPLKPDGDVTHLLVLLSS